MRHTPSKKGIALKWSLPEDISKDDLVYSFVFISHGQIRLKITGIGRIPGKGEIQPWYPYRNKLAEIWIGEGITEIGAKAFQGYGWIRRLWLPKSLRHIGENAFAYCVGLEKITFAGTIEQLRTMDIRNRAFPKCFRLI